jgi:hypothetical protein
VWEPIPLADALQRAYLKCSDIVKRFGCGKTPYDLMLFRVSPTEPLRQEILPAGAFDQLDGSVVTVAREGGASGQCDGTPGHYDYQTTWDNYCFTEQQIGNPMPRVFEFDRDSCLQSLRNERANLQQFEREIAELDAALAPTLAEFQAAKYFADDEPLYVHWVDDAMDAHGCICVPWRISVGIRHALVETWRGTWF